MFESDRKRHDCARERCAAPNEQYSGNCDALRDGDCLRVVRLKFSSHRVVRIRDKSLSLDVLRIPLPNRRDLPSSSSEYRCIRHQARLANRKSLIGTAPSTTQHSVDWGRTENPLPSIHTHHSRPPSTRELPQPPVPGTCPLSPHVHRAAIFSRED
jgi:hypothetical protein